MFQITVDMFSGRPNPSWTFADQQAQDIIREIALHKGVVSTQQEDSQDLGFRGIHITFESDYLPKSYGLPSSFAIANGASMYESKGKEIAERLLNDMPNQMADRQTNPPISSTLIKWITKAMAEMPKVKISRSVFENDVVRDEVSPFTTCAYEKVPFEPDFWNDPQHLRKNNCYNFATNRRTDTFAQPGRAVDHMYEEITCEAVIQGAHKDGLRIYDSCFLETEAPRFLTALVIAPGPEFVDFHWYRQCSDGKWAHKPGQTPARNLDNSNQIIIDPRTADREPYTQFCGFMLAPKSMQVL